MAQSHFAVLEHLRSEMGVTSIIPRKRGLGSMALCIHGTLFAALSARQRLVLRLPRQRVAELVLSGHGRQLEMRRGLPLHEWFVAHDEPDELLLSLARESLRYVESI